MVAMNTAYDRVRNLSGPNLDRNRSGAADQLLPEAQEACPSSPLSVSHDDATATRIISPSGSLRDSRRCRDFHHDCEQAVRPGRRRVVLNLTQVADADTKLVATLVAIARRARAAGVSYKILVSSRVRTWIALCRMERLLQSEHP